ncbi:hypothetical protein GCM10009820_37590 [Leifsonia soli]
MAAPRKADMTRVADHRAVSRQAIPHVLTGRAGIVTPTSHPPGCTMPGARLSFTG